MPSKTLAPSTGLVQTSIKCVLVGDGAVGKTSLLWSYALNRFPEEYEPTVFDNYTCHVCVDGKIVALNLWDTAGQEEYDRLRPLSYHSTDVFVIAFSLINKTSLSNISQKWLPELKAYCPNAKLVLVGNKSDLADSPSTRAKLAARGQEIVTDEEAEAVAKSCGATYVRASALTQAGLKTVFDSAIKKVLAPAKPPRPAKVGPFRRLLRQVMIRA